MKLILFAAVISLFSYAQGFEEDASFTNTPDTAMESPTSNDDLNFQEEIQEQQEFDESMQADEGYLEDAQLDEQRQMMQEEEFTGEQQMDPTFSSPEAEESEF